MMFLVTKKSALRMATAWLGLSVPAAAFCLSTTSEAHADEQATEVFVGCFETFEDCEATIPSVEEQWPDWIPSCSAGAAARNYCPLPDFEAGMFAVSKF